MNANFNPNVDGVSVQVNPAAYNQDWDYETNDVTIEVYRNSEYTSDFGGDLVFQKVLSPDARETFVDTDINKTEGTEYFYSAYAYYGTPTEEGRSVATRARVLVSYAPASPYYLQLNYYPAEGEIKGGVTAPAEFNGSYFELPADAEIEISVERSCTALNESWHEIYNKQAVAPDERIYFSDTTPFEQGATYSYRAKATYKGVTSDPSYPTTVLTGIVPGSVTDLKATLQEGGLPPVTITCKAPTVDDNDNNLPADTKLTITVRRGESSWSDNWTDITKIENVTPGEAVTVVDPGTDLEQNSACYYKVNASVGAISDYGATIQVYVGEDKPAAPRGIKAVKNGDKVEITWEPVTDGEQGGYVDPEKITYIVKRFYSYDRQVPVTPEEGVAGTSFIDDVSDLTTQVQFYYAVVAKNAAGESYSGTSDYVIAGPSPKLPYLETFPCSYETGYTDNIWNEGDWNITNYLYWSDENWNSHYFTGVESEEDPYDGAIYASINAWTPAGDITTETGTIDFTGVSAPQLTFYYFNIPSSKTKMDVTATVDGENFVPVTTVQHSEEGIDDFAADAEERTVGWWKKVVVMLPEQTVDAPSVVVRFNIPYEDNDNFDGCKPFYVDHVEIVDAAPMVTVFDAKLNDTDDAVILTWEAAAENAKYNVLVDGIPMNNSPIQELTCTYNVEEGKTYKFAIQAVYGEIASLPSKEVEITVPVYAKVADVKAVLNEAGDAITVSWTAPHESVIGYKVNLNGESLHATPITETTYTHTDVKPETKYSFTVTAVYEKKNAPESDAAVVDTPAGINSVIADMIESEVYFTPAGVRVVNPAKGQVVVKVSRLNDGSIVTSKEVIK